MEILLDGDMILDFIKLDCFRSVLTLKGYKFFITENVLAALEDIHKEKIFPGLIEEKIFTPVKVENIEEVKLFSEMSKYLSMGEASTLAAGVKRKWRIASDETGRFLDEIINLLGENYSVRSSQLLREAAGEKLIDIYKIKVKITELSSRVSGREEKIAHKRLLNLMDALETY